MIGALPPLWPLVAIGFLAAIVLVVITVRAIVRDWRRPVLDERGVAAVLTETRCRVDNVARRREDVA